MESVPRNVILDLLPIYLAGEASEESRSLVEEFAKKDNQISGIIQSGKLENDPFPLKMDVPEDLEMKTLKHVQRGIRRQMWFVALVTASILMVPLVAMQLTDEVNWNLLDFAIMGFLLSGTGITYVLLSRISEKISYRIAIGIALLTGLLLIWVNLAVRIIGSESNPVNLLYFGVLLVSITGAGFSRFQPLGMANTMFATAFAQLLVPIIVLIFWKPFLIEPPGIVGVFLINLFFAALFTFSALLFRRSDKKYK